MAGDVSNGALPNDVPNDTYNGGNSEESGWSALNTVPIWGLKSDRRALSSDWQLAPSVRDPDRKSDQVPPGSGTPSWAKVAQPRLGRRTSLTSLLEPPPTDAAADPSPEVNRSAESAQDPPLASPARPSHGRSIDTISDHSYCVT